MPVWWRWLLPVLICTPWLAGIAYYWRHRPHDGAIPLAMADYYWRSSPAFVDTLR